MRLRYWSSFFWGFLWCFSLGLLIQLLGCKFLSVDQSKFLDQILPANIRVRKTNAPISNVQIIHTKVWLLIRLVFTQVFEYAQAVMNNNEQHCLIVYLRSLIKKHNTYQQVHVSISLSFGLFLAKHRIEIFQIIGINRVLFGSRKQHSVFVLIHESKLVGDIFFQALETLLAYHIKIIILKNVLEDVDKTV